MKFNMFLSLFIFILYVKLAFSENYEKYYLKYIPKPICNEKSFKCYNRCLKLENQFDIYKCQLKCNENYLRCNKKEKEKR